MNIEKFQERFHFYKENFNQEELAKLLALRETEDQEPAPTTVIEPYPVYPTYPSPWEPPYTFRTNSLDGHFEITSRYTPNTNSTADATQKT